MKRVHPAGIFEAPIATTPRTTAWRRTTCSPVRGLDSFSFDDPYRAWPTLGDLDLHLLGKAATAVSGTCSALIPGSTTAWPGVVRLWAPNAQAVRVVGDWNFWDGRVTKLRSLGSSGVWELFIPGVEPGAHYKFELVASDNSLRLKADPMAFATEVPPGTSSVVADLNREHPWAMASG